MKLESIKIENYRCFENLTVQLEKDVTVFVGENGAGKSTILDAIAFPLFDIAANNGEGKNAKAREKNKVRIDENDIYMLSSNQVWFRGLLQWSAIATDFYNSQDIKASYDNINWGTFIELSHPKPFRYASIQYPNKMEDYFLALWREIKQRPNENIPLPAIAYYRAERKFLPPPPITNIPTKTYHREDAYDGCLAAGGSYDAASAWFFLYENYELRKRAEDPNFRDPILNIIRQSIISAFDDIDDIGFDDLPPNLKVTIAGKKLVISQLSDGYRVLIGLIIDFARRMAIANPNSSKPLEEPGILLIDEIELHLHPSWQQTIIPQLRAAFPNTQIIAATHSDQVLTTVEGRCIRIMKDGKLFSAPRSTYGADSQRVAQDVLGVANRPPNNIIVNEINHLYELINADQLDQAKSIIEDLKQKEYEDDPAVLDAEITVDNRLWEKEHSL